MEIKTDIEVQGNHFNEMKKKATQNRYNLLVYPVMVIFAILYMYLDYPELGTIPKEDPVYFIIILMYITGMLIYAWIRGTELNKIGNALTDDLDSICKYISLFGKFDFQLKWAFTFFLMFLLFFIKRNPELFDFITNIGFLIIIVLGTNQKIKDPMAWRLNILK